MLGSCWSFAGCLFVFWNTIRREKMFFPDHDHTPPVRTFKQKLLYRCATIPLMLVILGVIKFAYTGLNTGIPVIDTFVGLVLSICLTILHFHEFTSGRWNTRLIRYTLIRDLFYVYRIWVFTGALFFCSALIQSIGLPH